jgi:UDP-glucose 4-epimerase
MAKSGDVLGITGSYGYIGKRLLERLSRSNEFERVVCTDILSPPQGVPDNFQYYQCDIRDQKSLHRIFKDSGVNSLVHLAFIANPTRDKSFEYDVDVNGTSNVLSICKELKIKKLVVASSDCAYGFFDGTPDYLDESAPVRSTPGFPYSENKAEIEAMLEEFKNEVPDCSLVILRPCMVMGPNANNTTSRSMKQPVIIGVRHYDPIMQFVHEDDAAEAFYLALTKDIQGTFNLAADEGIRYSALAKELGRPMISLPAWLMYSLVETLYRLRLLPFGKAQLDYIRYPLSMNVDKIKTELGFKPQYSSIQTIQSFNRVRGSDLVG